MDTQNINLSPDQGTALDRVAEWLYEADKPYFVLHGAAGTGKTTLAKYLAKLQKKRVQFMAYTGKASQVLTSKGCPARTIHSCIYMPRQEAKEEAEELRRELGDLDEDADKVRIQKILARLRKLDEPKWIVNKRDQGLLRVYDKPHPLDGVGLIILDECSFVNKETAEDLLSFGIPVLVLGDPGQLPPVEGSIFFDTPDYMLTEVHRQALESPVLRLATMAREGKRLPRGKYGDSVVMSSHDLTPEAAMGVEQILCGSNKTRKALNQENRILRKFGDAMPMVGERFICLRNNAEDAVMNGEVFDLVSQRPHPNDRLMWMDFGFGEIKVHKQCFLRPEMLAKLPFGLRKAANEFDWAWAITIHKSQGSQYKSCLVYPDMFKWDPPNYAKLLYTGITRAEDRVVVVL